MKLEQRHQQHEARTTSSTTRGWNNIMNNTELKQHNHQQHEIETTSSTCGNKMRQVYQQQHLWYLLNFELFLGSFQFSRAFPKQQHKHDH
jgi:hypothetical protein